MPLSCPLLVSVRLVLHMRACTGLAAALRASLLSKVSSGRDERLSSSYRPQARRLRLIDGAARGQHDCIVPACPFHRQQAVGDIMAYPLGRSRKWVTITAAAAGPTQTNRSPARICICGTFDGSTCRTLRAPASPARCSPHHYDDKVGESQSGHLIWTQWTSDHRRLLLAWSPLAQPIQ